MLDPSNFLKCFLKLFVNKFNSLFLCRQVFAKRGIHFFKIEIGGSVTVSKEKFVFFQIL